MSDGDSVKVAVRVRPFNQREKDRSSKLCVRMLGKETTVINPVDGAEKKFTFDYSYWSHDGEQARSDGYNECAGEGAGTDGATYADQQRVFDDLGQGVLNNAYEGYNSCLFAYGQTGAGKSYSMVGYGTNKGIVPISCDEIFKRIDIQKAENEGKYQFQVTIQMLEIYNEQVRDLFSKAGSGPSGGLKVRMNPKSGVEVVGLTEWPVASYQEIEERIDTATRNRTVAATNMNATSSRAHTVVTICYTQLELNAKGPGKHAEKKAKMNLVDLAGSERAESTGATGDRLKEGAAINLSLTMLGNVITALAEKSNFPNKKVLVPYRDSKLTCILQDALGGNAKTIMVCAISPADINFEETVGTLRYADRAKQIKNKPKVNIDPTELLIQQLKEENERLKAQYGAGGAPTGGGAAMTEEEKEAMRKQLEEEMKAKMEENEKMMAEMSKSWEEKLKEAQEKASAEASTSSNEAARRLKEPHIINVHEDPVMSGAICYFLPHNEEINFGNRNSPGEEEILLGGVSIRPDHCRITNKDGVLDFGVREDCKVLLNGEDVTGKHGLVLHHNDRLVIGTNYYFAVVDPTERDSSPPEGGWPEVGWDFVQREIAKAQGLDVDVNWSAMTEEEKRRALLNDELVQVMPRVTEANALSKELDRHITFETKVTSVMHKSQGMTSLVMVKVINSVTEMEWLWEKDKFVNRVYLMRELYEKYLDGSLDPSAFGGEQDPFVDPNEPMHVGYSSVFLKSVAFCIASEDDYAIYHDSQQTGIMRVKIEPCKPDGTVVRDDDDEGGPYDEVDSPQDLIGKRLDVLVTIVSCKGLSKKFSSEIFIEFDLPLAPNPDRGDGRWISPVQKGTINPNFNFVQQITYTAVDEQILHRLENESAYFHVFGLQEQKGEGALQKKKLLSASEVEQLQGDLRKITADNERNATILGKIQELAIMAARNKDASESYILELANTLADAGLDVSTMVEAGQLAGQTKVVAAESAQNSSEEDKAKIAALELQLAAALTSAAQSNIAEQRASSLMDEVTLLREENDNLKRKVSEVAIGAEPMATPRDEKDAAIKDLEAKLAQLEAQASSAILAADASQSEQSSASGDEGLKKELATTKALLVAKEEEFKKQIHDAHEAERAAKAKLHEQNDELQSLRDGLKKSSSEEATTETPVDNAMLAKVATLEEKVSTLEKEKAQLKGEATQLKGQLDLAKAEAADSKKGSKGCMIQ